MSIFPSFLFGGYQAKGPTATGLLGQSLHHIGSGLTGFQPSKPKGYIEGLQHTVNGTDGNNDTDVAVGYVLSDDSAIADRLLFPFTAITKRLDATAATGTGNGGLSTGSKASGTWYATWAWWNPTTGASDLSYDPSFTSPTSCYSGYTKKALVGQVLTDGSSNILPYIHRDDFWIWQSSSTDVFTTSPTTGSDVTFRPATPPINTLWHGYGGIQTTSQQRLYITYPGLTAGTWNRVQQQANGAFAASFCHALTNSSGQLAYNASAGTYTGAGVFISTSMYDDLKGRC